MKSAAYLAIFFILFSCGENKEVNLKEFSLADDVFESGKDLMSLPFGLHELENVGSLQETLIIAVHGSNSRGYEWIYPLISLNDSDNLMAFFRWDDGSCPDPSIRFLYQEIDRQLLQSENIKNIILLGHSYGGILVTSFMKEWQHSIPLEIHSIAAPLKGMGPISAMCGYEAPKIVKSNTSLYQWRTIKELDGAFRDLDYDPQVVQIKDSKIIRLPETYKGNKLGHNWAISWVADEILGVN